MRQKGNLSILENNCLIGFDAEWTKNYKIKNGNVPFCFSIVSIFEKDMSFERLLEGDVSFKYLQYYCEDEADINDLIVLSEQWADKILKVLDSCMLCGHQISSDFSVLYNMGVANGIDTLHNLSLIRSAWRDRKTNEHIHITDTRYDIEKDFLGKSRRLVDMCNDFDIDVTQPELKNSSMTKLQNTFYATGDENIYERIAVMNLRHSLCAAVLYWLGNNVNSASEKKSININKIVYKCLKEDFHWVNSFDFSVLLENKKTIERYLTTDNLHKL